MSRKKYNSDDVIETRLNEDGVFVPVEKKKQRPLNRQPRAVVLPTAPYKLHITPETKKNIVEFVEGFSVGLSFVRNAKRILEKL